MGGACEGMGGDGTTVLPPEADDLHGKNTHLIITGT